MSVDLSSMKLGKLPVRKDKRTLHLARYIKKLPAAPANADWTRNVTEWPMFKNDEVGNCAIAAPAHLIESWTASSQGSPKLLTDADVMAAYRSVSRYDPSEPMSDTGCVMLDVLKWWRKQGIGNDRIVAFASVNLKSHAQICLAAYLFGGLYIGLELPMSAQSQEVWSTRSNGSDQSIGSWGGHAVGLHAYDPAGLTVSTWGELKRMTWPFFARYCSEAYASLSQDFLKGDRAPNGFDIATLAADLARVSN